MPVISAGGSTLGASVYSTIAKVNEGQQIRQAIFVHLSFRAKSRNLLLLKELPMTSLEEIVAYAEKYLRIREIDDWENALNGLQIENSGRVTKIGAAVDVSTRVLKEAEKKGVDL